jgi:prepilin-type N-terminal cleavage/methylation domain-containing protein
MRKNFKKAPRGFSITEILVAIVIISLLAGVVVASYTRAISRGRDGRRMADLSSMRDALELYYADNKSYVATGGGAWANASASLGALVPNYIGQIPADPDSGSSTPYRYRSNGTIYCLAANFEVTTGSSTCTAALEASYDYGVSNP